jgi:hypothetical protein
MSKNFIDGFRSKLLDTSNKNIFLSFKNKKQIRIVSTNLNVIANTLLSEKPVTFLPLPEPQHNLPDENTEEFNISLKDIKNNDSALKTIEKEESSKSDRYIRQERIIKDRVRQEIGLPSAKNGRVVSVEKWASLNNIKHNYELDITAKNEKNKDELSFNDSFQTLLYLNDLEAIMSKVRDEVRSSEQETGVNTLYVALGFLEWFESDSSDVSHLSPLLLYPCKIEKDKHKGKYVYLVSGNGQEVMINITLQKRLLEDFNILLPDLNADESPEEYIERVRLVITNSRWTIRPYATLSIFHFSRVEMYTDLDYSRWGGEDKLSKSGILSELFESKDRTNNSIASSNVQDTDSISIEEMPILIRDADSSQLKVVMDVMSGQSIVVKGPPGTGKSQTISNVIAAMLAKGKSVLFVAEKSAALDVV